MYGARSLLWGLQDVLKMVQDGSTGLKDGSRTCSNVHNSMKQMLLKQISLKTDFVRTHLAKSLFWGFHDTLKMVQDSSTAFKDGSNTH